ncbi:hypothetical protein QYF36_005882 [Acer negundo]|nr:hypothetical protein QYF36_005882 [Acer negundo]
MSVSLSCGEDILGPLVWTFSSLSVDAAVPVIKASLPKLVTSFISTKSADFVGKLQLACLIRLGTLEALEFDVLQQICFNDNRFLLLVVVSEGHGSSKDPTGIELLSEASSILIEAEDTVGMQSQVRNLKILSAVDEFDDFYKNQQVQKPSPFHVTLHEKALRSQSSSSLCPPDKNAIPGTAGGTVRQSAVTVYSAITSGFQRKASHQRSSSRVSSKRMTPERKRRAFGDVKRSSRRDWRLDSMFSTLMLARRLPMVPVLSSAAKIPFPGVAMYLAFWISSSGEYQNKAFGYRDI